MNLLKHVVLQVPKWPCLMNNLYFYNVLEKSKCLPHFKLNFKHFSNVSNVIFEKENAVPVQGTLDLQTSFNAKIISQKDIESLEKSSIKVIDTTSSLNPSDVKKLLSLESTLKDKSTTIFRGISKNEEINTKLICNAVIPVQYDVKANVIGSGSVEIQDMESKNISITSDVGNVTCKNIKAQTINLASTNGDITSPTVLQGNMNIKTENGNVSGIRFQGNHIEVETIGGFINVSAIYAESSVFKSASGTMELDNLHGNATVQLKDGSVKITGLDGSLRAEIENGEISVQVSRLDGLYLNSKNGNVEIKVPVHLQSRVDIEAKDIDIEKRLQVQGKFKKSEKGRTFRGFLGAGRGPIIIIFAPKGLVRISIQDWMSSVGGGMVPEFGPNEELK